MLRVIFPDEIFYKCKKCGDEICSNTHKKYIQCSCGALAVDGCADYIRVMGNAKDHKRIVKPLKALEKT